MLKVNNIEVVYNDVILVLRGVSFEVGQGQIVSLLGANGAGKSTTLKALSGLLVAERGRVTRGSIEFEGERIDNKTPDEIVRMGIVQVLEGRPLFQHLTVEDNLLTGSLFRKVPNSVIKQDLAEVYNYFPRLKEYRTRTSGYLSGGEQQMLAVTRALMSKPRLLLMDEPSMGLAPVLVDVIFEAIETINKEGMTILLVEQNAHMALQIANRGYVLQTGQIVLTDKASVLQKDPTVQKAYLGIE